MASKDVFKSNDEIKQIIDKIAELILNCEAPLFTSDLSTFRGRTAVLETKSKLLITELRAGTTIPSIRDESETLFDEKHSSSSYQSIRSTFFN